MAEVMYPPRITGQPCSSYIAEHTWGHHHGTIYACHWCGLTYDTADVFGDEVAG